MHYSISGSFENIDSSSIYLARMQENDFEYLNKSQLSEGKFEMTGSIAVPENLFIIIGDNDYDYERFFTIFLSGNNMSVSADFDSLRYVKIVGSPLQDELDQFNKSMPSRNLNSMKQSVFQYVKKHPKSRVSPFIVRQYLMLGNFYLNDLKTLDAYFDDSIYDSPSLIFLRKLISRLDKVAIGKKYIDLILPDTLGNLISISDYDGKYRLVDFWASWCKPCRAEYPHLKRVYKKYKNNDFTIIGVSIDRDANGWKNAIYKDRLKWIQMLSQEGFDSGALKTYAIYGVPYNIFIDPDGIIVFVNLHGEELNEKLKEIFGY